MVDVALHDFERRLAAICAFDDATFGLFCGFPCNRKKNEQNFLGCYQKVGENEIFGLKFPCE